MAVDERSRQELYRRLEEVLGADAAITLIEHLPPVGWADVATKHDLASLEQRMDLRFARIDERFNGIDERFNGIDERFNGIDERISGLIQASASELRATFEHEMRLHATAFEQALRAQTTTMVFALVGVVLTMAALAFALARFP